VRRVLIACAVLLGLVLVGVAFLPAILSSDFARSRMLAAARSRLTAEVDARDISFSWGGPQRIEGLRIGPPPGFPDDVLRVESIDLAGGLIGLALSGDPLVLEVKEPVFNVRRNAKGELNLEALVAKPAGEPERPRPEPEEPREPLPAPPEDRGPAFPRDVTLVLRGGTVTYRDELLEAASDVTGIEADLSGKADALQLKAGARVSHPDASSPGKASITLSAGGLRQGSALETLVLDLDAALESVDLRPYAGLIERSARARPPEELLDWKVTATTRAGVLELKTAASAGRSAALDATVTLSPPGPGRTWTLAGSAQGDLGYLVKAAPASAEVRVEDGSRVRIHDVAFKGKVPAPGAAPLEAARSVEGACRLEQSGNVTVQGWKVGGASGVVRAAQGRFALEEMTASVNGGKASCRASLDAGADLPAWSLSARLDDAQANYEITPLLQYVLPFLALEGERALFSGKLEGAIDLEGRGADRAAIEKDINGKGSVRVRDGGIAASRFFSEIAGALDLDLGEVLFSEMGSDFAILPGKVDVTKAYFTGKPGGKLRNLGLVGTTRFDGTIEFGLDVTAIRESIGSKRIRRVLEGIEKVAGSGILPLKVTGTLKSPKLTLSAPDAGGILDRVLGGEGKEEGDPAADAGKAVEDVFDLFRKKDRKKERKKPDG